MKLTKKALFVLAMAAAKKIHDDPDVKLDFSNPESIKKSASLELDLIEHEVEHVASEMDKSDTPEKILMEYIESTASGKFVSERLDLLTAFGFDFDDESSDIPLFTNTKILDITSERSDNSERTTL